HWTATHARQAGQGPGRRRGRRGSGAQRAAPAAAQEEEALRASALMAEIADTEAGRALGELLERTSEALGLEVEVEVVDDGETVTGTLHGEDVGLFIGRHGQTIDAVQHLAMRVVQGATEDRRRVVVDADGYRARRAETLERQADEAAESALRNGRPVSLEPMQSSERRIVHEYLRDRGDVETYSEGDEPDRRLVVAP